MTVARAVSAAEALGNALYRRIERAGRASLVVGDRCRAALAFTTDVAGITEKSPLARWRRVSSGNAGSSWS